MSSSLERPARSLPVRMRPSSARPSSVAMNAAVSGWSPVIITGRIPARLQVSTASLASGLAGSIIPTMPKKVKLSSSSSPAPSNELRRLKPTARTRMPFPASRAFAAGIEGNLPDSGERGLEFRLLHALAGGGHHQGPFGGVPYRAKTVILISLQQAVVAKGATGQEHSERRI